MINSEHVIVSDHNNIKWDHFDILASGKTDFYCEIKKTLFIYPGIAASIECQC